MRGPSARSVLDRFWEQVDDRGPDQCWGWRGHRNHSGYGVLFARCKPGSRGDRSIRMMAHRFSYELHTATEIPPGVGALHHCDNPPCCNPAHLFLGNHAANMGDASRKGRLHGPGQQLQGEANPFVKLTEVDVRLIRRLAEDGFHQRAIARRFGISQTNVSHIVLRKSWRHVVDLDEVPA